MIANSFMQHLQNELCAIEEAGLYKRERVLVSPQGSRITLADGTEALNFCANNYLGLANDRRVVEAAKASLDRDGLGMASVRFICGTHELHMRLEAKIAHFLGMEETILYTSCFDANGGLFETLLGAEDAVISDALNHASIIDGIRLSKAKRLRFQNSDMGDLEQKLEETKEARFRLIATDGVFSMDGIIARLQEVCALAEKYNALLMVDDSHATGFLGKSGKGSHEHCDVMGRVDILTGTLGKALGGASGGYISGKKEIIALLRQRSRPYLFSNTLTPALTAAALAVFDILEHEGDALRTKLFNNAVLFRTEMEQLGFKLAGNGHPIIPVMLGDAKLTALFAQKMLKEGIYVIGFFYPVVPQGLARIRTQISAAHSTDDIRRAVAAFAKIGKELGVI